MHTLTRSILSLFALSTMLWGCPADDDLDFDVELAGENQARAVATPASGTISADLEDNTLRITGSFQDLTSDLLEIQGSSAHIHRGSVGEDGPILFNVNVVPAGNNRGGDLSFTRQLSDADADLFRDGELYLNIHTENYPGGELRAQLIEDAPTFASVIWDTEAELGVEDMPVEIRTDASGFTTAILRDDNNFVLSGRVEDLEGSLMDVEGSSVNLYRGVAGQDGEFLYNLEVFPVENVDGSAFFNLERELSGDERQWLEDEELFILVFTDEFPDGELRGQLRAEPIAPGESFEVELAGDNQVPPVASAAFGTMTVNIFENTLTINGTFENLSSPLEVIGNSSAHIHEGALDESGPVVFDIDVTPGDEDLSGTFELSVELTEEQLQAFEEGRYYVNIHTENYPGGELRGQLIEDAPQFDFIVWEMQTELSPEDHAHAVDTDATGFMTAVVREGRNLVLSGSFENLSSSLIEIEGSSAHVHRGAAGESGEIVFDVEVLTGDGFSGSFYQERTLTEEEFGWLQGEQLYLNIHTAQFPAGELRGQLAGQEPDNGPGVQ